MLTLLLGPAGTGKTAFVMDQIRQAVSEGSGGRILLVPEQYSHEAERELCARCGDSLSLYAEVFSFTGLARRLQQELGGGARKLLDKGGRLLCMTMALSALGPRLKVYTGARRRAELQLLLLRALDELKSACVGPEQLARAAEQCSGALQQKLEDLSLITQAYDAVTAQGHLDPADRLSILADQIARSDFDEKTHVYVDGFIDFTYQELNVLEALLRKGVEMTVCLTADGLHGTEEIFALSRISAHRLMAGAEALGIPVKVREMAAGEGKNPALRFFSQQMLRYEKCSWTGDPAPIRLLLAQSPEEECEAAAARVLELVREQGCRWREIAVAVRGFESYRAALETAFRQYGVPLFVARRSEVLSRPVPALISLAYEIVEGGWELDDVLSYLRTGLLDLTAEDADLLGGYLFLWQLRGSAWEKDRDWNQHPQGYGVPETEESRETLKRINELRRQVSDPLLHFAHRSGLAGTAKGQAAALAGLLEELRLPEQLEKRSKMLEAEDRLELAGEYSQLWELTVSALEQCATILGDTEMDRETFGRLFLLMLSQYDIGLIPVALDRVNAGDFDRMRRRNIKHLIVLGCSDDRLPPAAEGTGVFSDEERERLQELSIDLGSGDGELWREFSLIYHCLTLPSESLCLIAPLRNGEGSPVQPAFVYQRARSLFGLVPETLQAADLRLNARDPALTLAAAAFREGGSQARAAAAYFLRREPERFSRLQIAARMTRGQLSPQAVERLYGRQLRLSASRIDRFASCKFAYFCQYGLKAKPHEPARFSAPEIGTFYHYLLENTAREVAGMGGFGQVGDEELERICDRYIQQYVHEELNDFREKTPRFLYLFHRICRDARQVVLDTAQELRRSEFEPLDFELDFSKAQDIRPLELGEGQERLALTGIADRVDGWVHENKLYLRVVDYKTGHKQFSLSDVWYGQGLQMLLYLFALEADGERRYGREIVPAGVMYVPAKSPILSIKRNVPDEEIAKERAKQLRRSGLVLDEPPVLEAWEKGEEKRYIPVKLRSSPGSTNSLASAERLGRLDRHIRESLKEMASELRRGDISADPWYRSQQENACLTCPYQDACFFSDGENGESCRRLPPLKDEQVWENLEQAQVQRPEAEQEAEHE